MSPLTPPSIEARAQELLRSCDALSVPVDVDRIASYLGVKVHRETLDDQAAGVLIVKGNEKHILVNKLHHSNRQRFTISHELGHLMLHEKEGDQVFVDREIRVYQRVSESSSKIYSDPESITTPQQEREANMFAAALLMPGPLLQHAALEHQLWDESDITTLAKSFAVSEQAMFIRLQNLNVVRVALDDPQTIQDANA